MIILIQEDVLSGGHGLMVQGYHPVIKALAKDIDIRLNHRYITEVPLSICFAMPLIFFSFNKDKHFVFLITSLPNLNVNWKKLPCLFC